MAKKIIKDILNMDYNDFMKFTKKENFSQFKTILQTLSQEANKRIKELNSDPIGKFSPAYKHLREDEGIKSFKPYKRISTKKRNELIHEVTVMKEFLRAKSSTLSGWNKIRSKIQKRLKSSNMFKSTYKNKSQASYWIKKEERFWDLYNKLVDEFGGIITNLDSKKIQKMLTKIMNIKGMKNNDDLIQEAMEDYIDKLYRAKAKGYKISDAEFIEKEVKLKYV